MQNRVEAWLWLLILGVASAFGQDHINGFEFGSPLGLSAGEDEHFIAGSQTLTDTVTLLTVPNFQWLKSTHRVTATVSYQPEFEMFADHPGLDAWDHTASLRLTERINSRLSLEIQDGFLSTVDPTRVLLNSLLLLPRGRFLQNAFYTALNERLNQTTKLIFRLDNDITQTDLPGDLLGRLDQVTSGASVTLERTVRNRHKFEGGYSFVHFNPLKTSEFGGAANVSLLNLRYSYEVSPDLILRASIGGVVYGGPSTTGAAGVDKRIGRMWISAGYQRYLGFYGDINPITSVPAGMLLPVQASLTPDTVYQVGSVRIWGNLTKRVGLQLNAQRALNGVDPYDRAAKSAVGQGRLDYKLTDRLVIFGRAEYYGQNTSQIFPERISRNRYFGGLEINLSSSPELDRSLRNGIHRHPAQPDTEEPKPPEDN